SGSYWYRLFPKRSGQVWIPNPLCNWFHKKVTGSFLNNWVYDDLQFHLGARLVYYLLFLKQVSLIRRSSYHWQMNYYHSLPYNIAMYCGQYLYDWGWNPL